MRTVLVSAFTLSASCLLSGCLTAEPQVKHDAMIGGPSVALAVMGQTPMPPIEEKPAPLEGNMFTRNWRWWLAGTAGALLATDYVTDGGLIGVFDDDDHRVADFSAITEDNNLARAADGSTLVIRDVADCDYNFIAEQGSKIECDASVEVQTSGSE